MTPIGYIIEKGKDKLWRIMGEEGIELILKYSYGFDLKPRQNISYDRIFKEQGESYAALWTTVIEPTYYQKTPHHGAAYHRRIKRKFFKKRDMNHG